MDDGETKRVSIFRNPFSASGVETGFRSLVQLVERSLDFDLLLGQLQLLKERQGLQ